MINVKGLRKRYGNMEVLKKITFNIEENEIFALLGPNGAGKTTSLECMEGLRGYDEGEIKLMGLNPEEALKKGVVGIQLQSSSLPYNICAKDAMELFCKWRGVLPRYDLLDIFGFRDIDRKKYKTMSTGQKRRLHLALALAQNPKILFLDEPTAGLDVEALCDRVAILVDGSIRKIGTPSEIALEVKRETIIKIRVDRKLDVPKLNNIEFHKQCNGYLHYKTEDPLRGLLSLLQYIKDNDYQLLDLAIDKPSLEERFIQIAKEG